MAFNVTEMRQQMGEAVQELRKRQDAVDAANRETEEETQWFTDQNARITALEQRIKREEDIQAREKAMAASQADPNQRQADLNAGKGWTGIHTPLAGHRMPTMAQLETHSSYFLQAWLRHARGKPVVEQEHRDAATFLGQDFREKEVFMPMIKTYRQFQREWRDLNVATSNKGLETIPEGFVRSLETAMLEFGGMRGVSEVIRTDSEGDLPLPTVNDTANKGVILDEATDFGSSVDPSFSQMILKKFKYSSKPVLISTELLQDSAFDLGARIGEMLAIRIARIQNDHFSTGGGTTLPKGVLVAGTAFAAADDVTISSDDVIGLVHSVDPAYRNGARFMMHDAILAKIRMLKESTTNAYIWQPGLQAGVPDRLLGYPYTINQSFPSTTVASAKVMAFGDFSKYKIRDQATLRLVRLDELYAATDQVAFICYLRSDGNLLDAGTHPIKYLQLLGS